MGSAECRLPRRKWREFPFTPRIMNPVKLQRAVLLCADQTIRESQGIVKENMPWIQLDVLSNPIALSHYRADGAVVFLLDDTAMGLVDAERIRANNRDALIVLLSSTPLIQCAPPSVARERFPYTSKADLVFAVNRAEFAPDRIISSVVRAAEDLLNIRKDAGIRRFIFLIVDDEPRWFSQFLPVLYRIIGQRAGVMITRTYEETLQFVFGVDKDSDIREDRFTDHGHGDDLVCLITDIYFPKGETLNHAAGVDLIHLVQKYYPRIPIIIASKAKEAADLRENAFLLPKGDPGSLQKLKDYILDYTGLGDFLICDDGGNEMFRMRNIEELHGLLCRAEEDTPEAQRLVQHLEAYGERDKFSTWLYMHSYRGLGDTLRPRRDKGRRLVTVLKRHLWREILRAQHTPLDIDGTKVITLEDLSCALRNVSPDKLQHFSDNDIISSWLDRRGYPELAEELRPIHGSGPELQASLLAAVGKWIGLYERGAGEATRQSLPR